MELKRILAKDARSAHERAMALYGRDALIISAAQYQGQAELIVAVELEPEPDPAPGIDDPGAGTGVNGASPGSPPDAGGKDGGWGPFQAAMDVVMRRQPPVAPEQPSVGGPTRADAPPPVGANSPLEATGPFVPAAEPPRQPGIDASPAPAPARVSVGQQPSGARAGPGIDAGEPYIGPGFDDAIDAPTTGPAVPRNIVDLVRLEIGKLRQEIQSSRPPPIWVGDSGLKPALEPLTHALLDHGIPVSLRLRLNEAMRNCASIPEAINAIRDCVNGMLPPPAPVAWRGIHALLGPSGAGKTSMCARLALHCLDDAHSDSIAWISLGDSRLGAWNQVKMLAAQAGVEAFRARDLPTLNMLLDELGGRGTVLIDTGGADYLRLAQRMSVESSRVQLHLVLGADVSPGSLQRLNREAQIAWSSLLITKLDESAQTWPLLGLLCGRPGWRVGATSAGERLTGDLGRYAPDKLLESTLALLQEAFEEAIPAAGHAHPSQRAFNA